MNKIELGKRVWELRKQGYSFNKISELTGLNKCVVSTILNYTKPHQYGIFELECELKLISILNKKILELKENLQDADKEAIVKAHQVILNLLDEAVNQVNHRIYRDL